ncbi:hypothetical protein [Morganella morganii]|uniref:hypothetical protein n=1 Tax=Morganella morganii TaxID=582 RepID=UPI0032DB06B3
MVSLKIARDKNLLLEIILSTIFYDQLLFEVTNNNKKVYYSIFPNRLSLKKQRIDDKIAMLQEHYSNKISIKNPISCFSVLTPALYNIIFQDSIF